MTWGGVTLSDFHPFHHPQVIVISRNCIEILVDAMSKLFNSSLHRVETYKSMLRDRTR